ncbi:MAG: hypothetical protein ACTHOC_05030 [Luteimonas sp.]
MKHWILAAALLGLAACGKHEAAAPANGAPDATPPTAAQPAAPAPAPAAPVDDAAAAQAPLQSADIDAYLRGMAKENALLRDEFAQIERARAADDSAAETAALFAMTSSDVDLAGAQAAGMAPARYDVVKDRIDEVQSKLDMLEGFRGMGGDSSAMQAQVGDPYASFAADVAAALKARQPQLAALRAEAMSLRVKAAGG